MNSHVAYALTRSGEWKLVVSATSPETRSYLLAIWKRNASDGGDWRTDAAGDIRLHLEDLREDSLRADSPLAPAG